MIVTHGPGAVRPATRISAVTIGNFDGVHTGHQAMLALVADAARTRGLETCVLTFEPHPRELFSPHDAPTRLTSMREKLELLAERGIDHTHVVQFTPEFASMSPEAFVERLLVGTLGARWVLIGDDFRFGAKRKGDFESLQTQGKHFGFEVEAMPTVTLSGTRVSSSAIRTALAAGHLARAAEFLGRNYSISGRVLHGDKLGRELGFPTANVELDHNRPPVNGIFAVLLHGVGPAPRAAVASLGTRPTVKAGGAAAVLEVHVFDFSADIYGHHVRVEFIAKIRDEEKYVDLETLKAQIGRDCDVARAILARTASVDAATAKSIVASARSGAGGNTNG
jgi:riboflavin kinase/FMN adenylyltransferase